MCNIMIQATGRMIRANFQTLATKHVPEHLQAPGVTEFSILRRGTLLNFRVRLLIVEEVCKSQCAWLCIVLM